MGACGRDSKRLKQALSVAADAFRVNYYPASPSILEILTNVTHPSVCRKACAYWPEVALQLSSPQHREGVECIGAR